MNFTSSPNLSLSPAQFCGSSGDRCFLLFKERHCDCHTASKWLCFSKGKVSISVKGKENRGRGSLDALISSPFLNGLRMNLKISLQMTFHPLPFTSEFSPLLFSDGADPQHWRGWAPPSNLSSCFCHPHEASSYYCSAPEEVVLQHPPVIQSVWEDSPQKCFRKWNFLNQNYSPDLLQPAPCWMGIRDSEACIIALQNCYLAALRRWGII